MSTVIICPNAMEWATRHGLIARGFALSNVCGRKRMLTVAHRPRVPTLPNVVALHKRESAVEAIFNWLAPEMHR